MVRGMNPSYHLKSCLNKIIFLFDLKSKKYGNNFKKMKRYYEVHTFIMHS